MRELLVIAVAGALGSVARYIVSGLAYRLWGELFPYGTLAVNVTGSAFLGLVLHVGMSTDWISRDTRLFLGVGFLGAFTTFSTFSYETVRYAQDGAWSLAVTNILANLVLGLAAVGFGLALGRILVGGT